MQESFEGQSLGPLETKIKQRLRADGYRVRPLFCDSLIRDVARIVVEHVRETLHPVMNANLPLFLQPDCTPTLSLATGSTPHRILVCSIPKSGTYLLKELLQGLGATFAKIHLADWGLADLRFANLQQVRAESEHLLRFVDPEEIVPLIQPGQVVVGHLPCTERNIQLYQDFRIIFSYRNLRDCLVSFMRYVSRYRIGTAKEEAWPDMEDGPEKLRAFLPAQGMDFVNMALPMFNWLDRPGVLSVSYEELVGDYGVERQIACVERLADLLEVERPDRPEEAIAAVLGTDTATWSGSRSNVAQYWSDEAEEFLTTHFGADVHRRLGYPAESARADRQPPAGGAASSAA